jgi:predicted glycogen debranching enzyme
MEDRVMRPANISEMNFNELIGREWIATNGLGGYASSTICGMNTRKYHGLLVAAMAPPARRMVLLSHVEEIVRTSQDEFALGNNEYPGTIFPQGYNFLRAFNVDPFPRWAYQGEGFTIEKSLRLLEGENTACLSYSLLTGEKSVTLEIKALLALRPIHELMYQWNSRLAAEVKPRLVRIPATSRTPEIFFVHDGEFRAEPHWHLNTIYRRENDRGYSGLEDLWKPGVFKWTLSPGQTVHLVCATEPTELARVCAELDRARDAFDRQTAIVASESDETLEMLARAAESFVVTLPGQTSGERSVHVIKQYPWSSTSGRAALVGFRGLLMVPGRMEEGKSLLFGLAAQMRGAHVPTDFTESGEPTFNGADTALWFVDAVGEYCRRSADDKTAAALFAAVEKIIGTYQRTDDEKVYSDKDGLVGWRSSGAAGTWMDAQLGDWVMTPRMGQPVELNALWYNALVTASKLASKLGKAATAQQWEQLAAQVQESFNRRFWNSKSNCCYDVVDGEKADGSIRPNQIFALSLPYSVLAQPRHEAVIQKMISDLLTPMGVRSLAPGDPGFQGRYAGNIVSRDRALHQGSVYPWLLGPLVSAYVKLHGRGEETTATISRWLSPCLRYMASDGMGQICEIFDGESPKDARGALASSLGAGELLRAYAQDVLGISTLRRSERSGKEPGRMMPAEPAARE